MSIYGCKHEARIGEDPDGTPAVCLANTHDGEYVQYFTEQDELIDFICELVRLNNEIAEKLPGEVLIINEMTMERLADGH